MKPLKTALAIAALGAVAAPPAADAISPGRAQSEQRPAGGWTRTLDVRLTPRQLHLPADASPRRLARAALRRHAHRLGLNGALRGVRLARALHAPAGPAGAGELHSLRFRQTSGGLRVLWSQIDVAVTRQGVGSISATVVPVRPGNPQGARHIGRVRALAIARRQVRGPEHALRPQLVAHAGLPTTRKAERRAPRLAWVVEVLGEHSANSVCVVIDAGSGKVIASWKGHAARPERHHRRIARTTRAGAASDAVDVMFVDVAVNGQPDNAGGPGAFYSLWKILGPPFIFSEAERVYFTSSRHPNVDTAGENALKVVEHMCHVRQFCGRDGRQDGSWEPFRLTGNATLPNGWGGQYSHSLQRVWLTANGGLKDDGVAHELGHLMDKMRAGDRLSGQNREGDEVEEALADMFAYDYDRADATLGEDDGSPSRNWADPGSIVRGDEGDPYPDHMTKYKCRAEDEHFNSTILSHAYWLFVQDVGHTTAGRVLHYIPSYLPPAPRFISVYGGFVRGAGELYPFDSASDADAIPEVREAVYRAFREGVGGDFASARDCRDEIPPPGQDIPDTEPSIPG